MPFVTLSYPIMLMPDIAERDTLDPSRDLIELAAPARRTNKFLAEVQTGDSHAAKVAKLHTAIKRFRSEECMIIGCPSSMWRGGLCAEHYQAREAQAVYCQGPGCRNASVSKGLCATHYAQQKRGATLADYTPRKSRGMKRIRLPAALVTKLGPAYEVLALRVLWTYVSEAKPESLPSPD